VLRYMLKHIRAENQPICAVNALLNSGKLPPEQGLPLIEAAQDIIWQIGQGLWVGLEGFNKNPQITQISTD
jgi:hypothetical protein